MSLCFFFFKQKTAYEMRISDWSSDVCSSDLKTIVLITNDVDEALLLADRVVILEPAGALGETFPVDIQRPRNRTELNHELGYQQLRNRITACLGKLNKAQIGRAHV